MIMVQLKRRKDKCQSKMMSVMKGNLENCCWAAAFHSLFTWSVVHFVQKGALWPIKKISISYFLSFLGIVIRSDWPLVSWGCHPKPDLRDHLWKQNHFWQQTWKIPFLCLSAPFRAISFFTLFANWIASSPWNIIQLLEEMFSNPLPEYKDINKFSLGSFWQIWAGQW